MISGGPGETKIATLTESTVQRLRASPSVRIAPADEADAIKAKPTKVEAETDENKVELSDNPLAIEQLIAKEDAGEISWQDFRKQADVFLEHTPASKADILEALRARAAELRSAQ